jgi:NitT/TauT family transport system substrate-binding protein
VHFYGHSLFTTDELIAQDPELMLRFLRAALRGWHYAVENPDTVGELVQQHNPKADPALEVMRAVTLLPLVNTGEDHIGWMQPARWAAMAETLRAQDVLSGTLDITTVYDLTFLEQIYQ